MIPDAFGSEIAKIPPMDDVLRRHSENLLKVVKRRGPGQIKVVICFR